MASEGPKAGGAPPVGGKAPCTYCGHFFEVAKMVKLEGGAYRYACVNCAQESTHGQLGSRVGRPPSQRRAGS